MFTANRATTTTLARTPVLLWRTDEYTWRIVPRAFFAEHTAFGVSDAMQEYDDEFIDYRQ